MARSLLRLWFLSLVVLANAGNPRLVGAQGAPPPSPAITQAGSSTEDDPAVLVPAVPDVVVVNLPTGMRMPLFKGNFRMTHRFGGNLRNGSFSDIAGNLFGLDQGAIIGIEYLTAIAPRLQAGFHRSSFEKTIQFHTRYEALRQGGAMPISVSGLVSIEGTGNFHERYAPAAGFVISRRIGTRVAVYLTPVWVGNTQPESTTGAGRDTTFMGFGGRVRLGGSTYLSAEVVARAGGYAPDQPGFGFGLEKRAGGHVFSLTFTNTFGTTFAQLARGGAADTLYLGFNLTRKFF
jgi:hypothetical protein